MSMREKVPEPQPTPCLECGEAVSPGDTAVAAEHAETGPGLVHPGCYPRFAARQRREAGEDPDARPDRTA